MTDVYKGINSFSHHYFKFTVENQNSLPELCQSLEKHPVQVISLLTGADLGGFLRFPETGQVYSGNQNYILQ